MSLPCSVAAHEAAVRLMGDPLTTRQLQDLRLGELRHHCEVICVEVFLNGKSRVLDPRGNRIGGAGGELQFGQAEQELGEGLVAGGGVSCQLFELAAYGWQP